VPFLMSQKDHITLEVFPGETMAGLTISTGLIVRATPKSRKNLTTCTVERLVALDHGNDSLLYSLLLSWTRCIACLKFFNRECKFEPTNTGTCSVFIILCTARYAKSCFLYTSVHTYPSLVRKNKYSICMPSRSGEPLMQFINPLLR